jgi:starch phosphorylase
MGCDVATLMALGQVHGRGDFNMTALAIRGSRHHNGVSEVHGEVSSKICADLWPQIDPSENPIGHVTNGVHVPTFLSDMWHETFDRILGPGWSQRLTDMQVWQQIHQIPDHMYWSVRQLLKSQMLHLVRHRITQQHMRSHGSEAHIDRLMRLADPENPNVLTIGFARRFATYKRASLLFQNLAWLKQIVSDPERPVVFIFAGKAHPADEPGQALIRRIAEVANMPEFMGHILLVEGYDLRLARRLVSGVDVWLNNPVYPLEASGTSGMKAAINGVLNLSVLDGWWAEGYQGGRNEENGWAIKPTSSAYDHGVDESRRDYEEARTLYELLQDKIAPLYYNRGAMGYSPGWVTMSKQSIASITPRFNSARMVGEYVSKFYQPAARQWQRYSGDNFAAAKRLAEWKTKVRAHWPRISLRRVDDMQRRISFGSSVRFEIAVQLDGLEPTDVAVELLFSRPNANATSRPPRPYRMEYRGPGQNGESLFSLELTPEVCGKIDYRLRVYPYHELLTHPFEMGMMVWL